MISVYHTNIYKIHDYSQHLKQLTQGDKISRFGYPATDHSIDQMVLNMCYNPSEHELWYARTDDKRVGWGHLAKNSDGSWELAVSVQNDYQHLASKNNMKTKSRGGGERISSIEVPPPNAFEVNSQLWKEHNEIIKEYGKLRNRLTELWATPMLPK